MATPQHMFFSVTVQVALKFLLPLLYYSIVSALRQRATEGAPTTKGISFSFFSAGLIAAKHNSAEWI